VYNVVVRVRGRKRVDGVRCGSFYVLPVTFGFWFLAKGGGGFEKKKYAKELVLKVVEWLEGFYRSNMRFFGWLGFERARERVLSETNTGGMAGGGDGISPHRQSSQEGAKPGRMVN
jgi:hypothetical protein